MHPVIHPKLTPSPPPLKLRQCAELGGADLS